MHDYGARYRRLLPIALIIVTALALWELRLVMPIELPQEVGTRNGDLYNVYYPVYSFAYQGDELLPAWNPYQMAGTPTVGYLAGGLYYPPNFLAAVMPVHRAMGALAAMHLALGGVGTLLLAQSLGLSWPAALLAALGFMSNAFFVSEHLRLQYLAGLAWIPFAGLAFKRLLVAPTALNAVGLGVVLALQFATGHAQIVCYEAYLGLVVGVAAYLLGGARRRGHVGRFLIAALGATTVAILLAAAQLLPTLEVMGHAVRGFGGLTIEQTLPLAPSWAFVRDAATSSGVVFLLAPLSALAVRGRRSVVAIVAMVGAFAAAVGCGTRVYTDLFYHLPGVSLFRLPQQMLVVAALTLSLLAGLGVDALRARPTGTTSVVALAGVLLLAFGLRDRLEVPLVLAVAACIATFGACAVRGRSVLLPVLLLLAVATGERFVHTSNTHMIPAANDDAFFEQPRFVQFLRNAVGFDRILVVKNWKRRFPLMEKLGSLYRLAVVQDYEPLTPQVYHRFLAGLEKLNFDKPLFWGRFVAYPTDDGWRALDLLSTRWVVADPNVGWVPRRAGRFRPVYRDADAVIYENTRSLPRAQIVGGYRVVSDDETALRTVLDDAFDPTAEVVLDREPSRQEDDERPDLPASATIVARTATTVSIDVSTPRSALLLLNDLFWPGWTATVDGTNVEVYRANALFRAIAIPPGSSAVVFSYAGERMRIGLAISLLAALCCAGVVAQARWRDRSASPPEEADPLDRLRRKSPHEPPADESRS